MGTQENTTASVVSKFDTMRQRGVRRVALFCWPGAGSLWAGLLHEWRAQLRAFATSPLPGCVLTTPWGPFECVCFRI